MIKPTQYLVVLSPSSELGKTFLNGTHDFQTTAGAPCLLCTSLENWEFGWLRVERPLASKDDEKKKQQRLLIPERAVVVIHELASKDEIPFGFVPATVPKQSKRT